jgi:hypothetical protein
VAAELFGCGLKPVAIAAPDDDSGTLPSQQPSRFQPDTDAAADYRYMTAVHAHPRNLHFRT